MTAPAEILRFVLVEERDRVCAVDVNGIEICGARRPFGHDHWSVYMTVRLTNNMHQVLALTKEAAVEHVRLIADLYTRVLP
jgi:hypothetical protein